MNKSKKVIKGSKKQNKKQFTISPVVWIVIATVVGLSLIIGLLIDQLYKRPLLTIDGKKYYVEDLTYQFYIKESYYESINQMYGGQYWDMYSGDPSGLSVRDYTKLETLNNIIYEEILYNEAIEKGYSLTQEEQEKIDEDISSFLNSQELSKKSIKKNGFTTDYLQGALSKNTLASRYKQDIINGFEIVEEDIKAGISYDEYRQYDMEYLFIPTQITNEEDYSKSPMNEVEKKLVLDKITAYRDKALNTEEWSSLIPEDEEDLIYRTSSFTSKDTYFSEDLKTTMIAMGNGQISEIIEEEDGYYLIRMINNNSSESYDQAVDQAIKAKEEELFSYEFENNIMPIHSYTLHNKAVNKLRMGRITLVD